VYLILQKEDEILSTSFDTETTRLKPCSAVTELCISLTSVMTWHSGYSGVLHMPSSCAVTLTWDKELKNDIELTTSARCRLPPRYHYRRVCVLLSVDCVSVILVCCGCCTATWQRICVNVSQH